MILQPLIHILVDYIYAVAHQHLTGELRDQRIVTQVTPIKRGGRLQARLHLEQAVEYPMI